MLGTIKVERTRRSAQQDYAMPKTSAPSRNSSQASRPHAHRKQQAPLGVALKLAVQKGHAFGEAHMQSAQGARLPARLKRLG